MLFDYYFLRPVILSEAKNPLLARAASGLEGSSHQISG